MVFIVQINIEDKDLLDKYADIINATTSTSKTKSVDLGKAVIAMEKELAETLFRGKKLKSISGRVAPPDWWVTESGMKALFNDMVGKKKSYYNP